MNQTPLGGYTFFTLIVLLSIAVYAAITFLGSTLLRSPLGAAGIGLAALAITLALGALPGVGEYMPTGLYAPARAVAMGEPTPNLFLPVAVNLILVIVSLFFAWFSFRRQSL